MDPIEDVKPEKENEVLLNIRQKNRDDLHNVQHNKRLSAVDRQRCGLTEIVANIQEHELLTEKDVAGLSSRIKRRKSATPTDLKRLSAAFLHDPANIEAFSKIPGALNVVVKELSGNEIENQVLAAEVLCNLALGEDVCSKKIAQAAGSYLILYLDCVSNKLLVETSLWVIQNLLLSGEKTRKVLIAQGLPEKLVTLMETKDDDLRNLSEETFAMLVVEAFKDLPEEFLSKILPILVKILHHNSSGVFFAVYSTLMELNFVTDFGLLSSIVQFSTEILIQDTSSNCLMALRIIANALEVTNGNEILVNLVSETISRQNSSLANIVNNIISVDSEKLSQELFWFLSVLNKYSNLDLSQLKIPIKYL
ncbi:uncharacterized protein LOC134830959 [Culicoides brevitarsis]|uniref:uncharacterized protein LOC134830959 n=1 Tax=Culicoides brevitarsis TaxID=469753 RepID=UPI00307C8E68